MNIIETKNLCYGYDENKLAINNVNISLEMGKTTAILGGNGAGKSTIFLNLNGVLKPQSGEVLFNQNPIDYSKKGIMDIRKKVGIVFQDPEDQLFSSNVRKDISFGAIKLGLSDDEVKRRVDKAIRDTGIEHIEDKPTYALSYGQKKRVAIAGVLVMRPEVIILDEPTAGLDPKGVSEILGLINKIKEENKVTFIIATHEIDIVPIYCDNAYILNNGEVVFQGSIKELFQNPEVLRKNHLRLPRISHLMEILNKRDGIKVDKSASTISLARESIKELFFEKNNNYIVKDGKKLRYGYTTGSCAAAAAKAATYMLLTGQRLKNIDIMTPKGYRLDLKLEDINIEKDVYCAIKKDSGDDPDITNEVLVYARASKSESEGIHIDGGVGVGRVTKKGLQCKVGEAAINKVPRQMIETEVNSVLEDLEYYKGIDVEIFIPRGEEIAKKTFNERLGIVGGISVLGTSGIVEPMSEKALLDSIKLEIKMLSENGDTSIVVVPGNYGEAFTREKIGLDIKKAVKCSNYIGEILDYSVEFGIKEILLIGHIGKFIKLAAGIMNTHSKYADGRIEILVCNAALEGVDNITLEKISNAITTDEALEYLRDSGFIDKVMFRISEKIHFYLTNRVYKNVKIGAIVFSNEYGLLCKTKDVDSILENLI